MKRFHILTLFPDMFLGYFGASILARAKAAGVVDIRLHDLREYTSDKHRTVDDRPFGGGPGMVLKPEPIFTAVEDIATPETHVILLAPSGQPYRQKDAQRLSESPKELLLICGNYEGFDERVRTLAHEEISLGDFVLTCGALPAMAIVDSVTRLLPGALGDEESPVEESFSENLLEYPHYTRPASFRGMDTPEVLLSGNHAAIAQWRREQSLERTQRRRPDLLEGVHSPHQDQTLRK